MAISTGSDRAGGWRRNVTQHRGPLAVADLKPDFKTIADFRRDNRAAFAPCSASSCCCADASTCTAANCWRSTEPASRRSTTRIATSPALRCESSSAAPTSGWKTTSSGSTRAMSRTARQAAAHARESGRKDRSARREARPLPSDAGAARADRRGPDLADRS